MFKYIGKDNKIEGKKLTDLTVNEFKEIIREVVAEEVAKHNFVIPTVPVHPFYYQSVQPWEAGKVYCTTSTTTDTKGNNEKF